MNDIKRHQQSKTLNSRAIAARALSQILGHEQNLDGALQREFRHHALKPVDQALVQQFAYGVMRWLLPLQFRLDSLLLKPLKEKDRDLRALMLLGLYQLYFMRMPAFASTTESVKACRFLHKDWARNWVNAILRQAQRQWQNKTEFLHQNPYAHAQPDWLLQCLQQNWRQWQDTIITANNRQPPFYLRVNQQKLDLASYGQRLDDAGIAWSRTESTSALLLQQAMAVSQVPGFIRGEVSVQDVAAQLAFEAMEAKNGERILDACAAPGGKTAHLLEQREGLKVVAVERHQRRAQRLRDNLQRLSLSAEVIIDDAGRPDSWWNGKLFDRILLDAPCSGSGVIARHPDIKYLKQSDNIQDLLKQQKHLLHQLWPLLKPGGRLLYTTCSILPAENEKQIRYFCSVQDDCRVYPIKHIKGIQGDCGLQRLPGVHDGDGFYYAALVKCNSS